MIKTTIRSTSKAMILFLAFWLIAFPIFSQVRDEKPIIEAEAQAHRDVSSILWIAAGCIMNFTAIIVGYLVPLSTAPSESMLGKSPEYVAVYSDAYKRKVKNLQGKNALIGCGISSIGWIVYAIIIVAATASTETYYY